MLSSSYTLIDIDIHLLDSKQQLESPVKDEGHYYDTQSSDLSLFFYFLQPILLLPSPSLSHYNCLLFLFSSFHFSFSFRFAVVSPAAHVRWQQIETADSASLQSGFIEADPPNPTLTFS